MDFSLYLDSSWNCKARERCTKSLQPDVHTVTLKKDGVRYGAVIGARPVSFRKKGRYVELEVIGQFGHIF